MDMLPAIQRLEVRAQDAAEKGDWGTVEECDDEAWRIVQEQPIELRQRLMDAYVMGRYDLD